MGAADSKGPGLKKQTFSERNLFQAVPVNCSFTLVVIVEVALLNFMCNGHNVFPKRILTDETGHEKRKERQHFFCVRHALHKIVCPWLLELPKQQAKSNMEEFKYLSRYFGLKKIYI